MGRDALNLLRGAQKGFFKEMRSKLGCKGWKKRYLGEDKMGRSRG